MSFVPYRPAKQRSLYAYVCPRHVDYEPAYLESWGHASSKLHCSHRALVLRFYKISVPTMQSSYPYVPILSALLPAITRVLLHSGIRPRIPMFFTVSFSLRLEQSLHHWRKNSPSKRRILISKLFSSYVFEAAMIASGDISSNLASAHGTRAVKAVHYVAYLSRLCFSTPNVPFIV